MKLPFVLGQSQLHPILLAAPVDDDLHGVAHLEIQYGGPELVKGSDPGAAHAEDHIPFLNADLVGIAAVFHGGDIHTGRQPVIILRKAVQRLSTNAQGRPSGNIALEDQLIPAVREMAEVLLTLERENEGIVKSGRTHLQDAVPIAFSQEISGWRASLERDLELLRLSLPPLYGLALGGTAVGTGLNAPAGFAERAAEEIAALTGKPFVSEENKFHALTSLDELVFAHGAVKALAADMMKIANDVRWLASGPRCGLGEITIPANEPGSSIMPGKVNPTQCEQVTMVAVQVMGNDAAVGIAASQGNFELNVFLPVVAYNFLQSVRLTAESIRSFTEHCACGIRPVREKMRQNLAASLMTVTALNPHIGYENAARAAQLAHAENLSLKDACVKLGLLTPERFDELFHPEKMI